MIGKVVEGRYAGASVDKLPDNALYIQTEDGTKIALSKNNAISIDDVTDQYPSYGRNVMLIMWNDFETSILCIDNLVYEESKADVPVDSNIILNSENGEKQHVKIEKNPGRIRVGVIGTVCLLAGIIVIFLANWHKHTWQPATCTSAKVCLECGKTKGEMLPHTWLDATCTELKTCEVCSTTEGDYLPHTWLDATCTKPMTCSVCNTIEGNVLPHDWVAATCEAPQTCSVCLITEGEALEHSVKEWLTTKEPTCSENGIKSGFCVFCGAKDEQNIEMLEHVPGGWTVVQEASLYQMGVKAQYCTICEAETKKETFTASPEVLEADYKAVCKSYIYDQIARNPDAYDGEYAVFTGEVIQAVRHETYGLPRYILRVNVTKSGRYYTDTVYVTYTALDRDSRILEDDIIIMYGTLDGEETYKTILGATVTIPAFNAGLIKIIG